WWYAVSEEALALARALVLQLAAAVVSEPAAKCEVVPRSRSSVRRATRSVRELRADRRRPPWRYATAVSGELSIRALRVGDHRVNIAAGVFRRRVIFLVAEQRYSSVGR